MIYPILYVVVCSTIKSVLDLQKKVVTELEFMASTVVNPVLQTVYTIHVTYNMGNALNVSLDGKEQCVTRVCLFTTYIMFAKIT